MADLKSSGGGEDTRIYLVKSDHSAIVQSDGTTTATTNAHALISITTGLIKPVFGVDKITLNTVKNDAAMKAFVKAYAAAISSADVDGEVQYGEKGTKHDVDAGVASDTPTLLIVWKGATTSEGIETLAALCSLDADSRNREAEFKKLTQRNLNFTPIAATAALAVANGLLPTPADYDSGETLTIALGEAWEDTYLDPAA